MRRIATKNIPATGNINHHSKNKAPHTILVAASAWSTAAFASVLGGCTITIHPPSSTTPPPNPTVTAPLPSTAPAATSLTAPAASPAPSRDTATVMSISESSPPGLKIVNAELVYNDGDVLTADFRVYCPTSMIRPTNFRLTTASGAVKRQGSWWEASFQPRWEAERSLIQQSC